MTGRTTKRERVILPGWLIMAKTRDVLDPEIVRACVDDAIVRHDELAARVENVKRSLREMAGIRVPGEPATADELRQIGRPE